ncbi:MAG: alpha/beta fold hydrolase [Dehalococcoidia bacterium]|jgi:pimeloyl-ACP methyl ester carboxylesterase|nr:alpha/beta fold hydrolase [Dehalococcoidia bacterium]
MDQFAARWHVYAIDFRGHGESGRTPDKYEFGDYPTEVVEFLREVVNKTSIHVGHSLGGVTAAGASTSSMAGILTRY